MFNTGKVTIIFLKMPVVICLCPSIVSFLSSGQWWNKRVIFSFVIPKTQLQSSSWSCGSPSATIVPTSSLEGVVRAISVTFSVQTILNTQKRVIYLLSSIIWLKFRMWKKTWNFHIGRNVELNQVRTFWYGLQGICSNTALPDCELMK